MWCFMKESLMAMYLVRAIGYKIVDMAMACIRYDAII